MCCAIAGHPAAAVDAPDGLAQRAAASVVGCLSAADASYVLWESKHKSYLKGSARVLQALYKHPSILEPIAANPGKLHNLRILVSVALPVRHKTFLAQGKGWQGACATAAEAACAGLSKKLAVMTTAAGRRKSAGGAGGGGAAVRVLGTTALAASILAVAAVYRLEVGGVLHQYIGADATRKLDTTVLLPLQTVLHQAYAAAQPVLQQVEEHVGPHVTAVQQALQPYVHNVQEAAHPYVEQLQQFATPIISNGTQLWHQMIQQLDDIWQRAKQQ